MKEQCDRLLNALRKGPLTTGQIRERLGIGMPATRIFELKQQSHTITTLRVEVRNRFGGISRVAKYMLVEEAKGQGQKAA